eukprot:2041474-Pleurochrysis_carterae.AAC.1
MVALAHSLLLLQLQRLDCKRRARACWARERAGGAGLKKSENTGSVASRCTLNGKLPPRARIRGAGRMRKWV